MGVIKGIGALVVLAAPIGIVVCCAIIFQHDEADIAYFETVAQVIPILIVGLAIEARYFAPRKQLAKALGDLYFECELLGKALVVTYTALTFALVVLSEGFALTAIAKQQANAGDLGFTVGGLLAGIVALVTAVLIPDRSAADSGGADRT